jgi:hypothetical protein
VQGDEKAFLQEGWIVTGELDWQGIARWGPHPRLPWPCIYIGELQGQGGRELSWREVAKIAEVLIDREETRQTIFIQYATNAVEFEQPVRSVTREAAVRLGKCGLSLPVKSV